MARELLATAEYMDGYRSACTACPLNRAARSQYNYAAFSLPTEKAERLLEIVDTVPLAANCDLLILHPSADNGYPHTRPPNLICLPASKDSELPSRTTLLHEAIHIHQRRYAEEWTAACKQRGWTPLSPEMIPSHLRASCRINPDTMSPTPFWAWKEEWVPLPLFTPKRPESLTLADVVVKWWNRRTDELFGRPPQSFTDQYGANPPQPEHPYELLAVEFSERGIDTHEKLMQSLLLKK